GCGEAVGNVLAVEDEVDGRAIQPGVDRQLDDALELAAIRLRVTAENNLGGCVERKGECEREQSHDEGAGETCGLHKSPDSNRFASRTDVQARLRYRIDVAQQLLPRFG